MRGRAAASPSSPYSPGGVEVAVAHPAASFHDLGLERPGLLTGDGGPGEGLEAGDGEQRGRASVSPSSPYSAGGVEVAVETLFSLIRSSHIVLLHKAEEGRRAAVRDLLLPSLARLPRAW